MNEKLPNEGHEYWRDNKFKALRVQFCFFELNFYSLISKTINLIDIERNNN